jgi:DTW domain-containing protein YfiP
MSLAPVPKRAQCAICLRPQSTCICRWITPVAHEVEVVILQHPREVDRSKGTARLLQLSLANCRIVVGEQFAPAELLSLLTQPLSGPAAAGSMHALLLYPDTPGDPTLLPPPVWDSERSAHPSQLRLVVLDGTWRESRKLLHLDSRYLIRKAQRTHQLSTLEATCAALSQLEGNPGSFQPLLSAFDGFVAQQSGYMKTH